MPINKFTTLLDLSRQAKILTGETATFDGKISSGIPFSGYPTGVDTATTVSLGVISTQTAVFSGGTGTTVFDVSNIYSPYYNPSFDAFSATTWSNPLFSANTSGLTLPITILSADTQSVGPFWTLTQTGYTGEYIIGTQYTGYSITYSFSAVATISSPDTFSGLTTASQEIFSAGTLDYKGPLDYLYTSEDATIKGRLTTNKLTIENGASSATTNYILVQIDDTGKAEWASPSIALSGLTIWTAGTGTNSAVLGGSNGIASGSTSVSEGVNTKAGGIASHAEGGGTQALGDLSHAEGEDTIASNTAAHAEGVNTVASGVYSHAEGSNTIASNARSHAEGYLSIASGVVSHAEGESTLASGDASHSEGENTISSGVASHAEGSNTIASGATSHAEGDNTNAGGVSSHAEGDSSIASGTASHAEGFHTISSNFGSHAEGGNTTASGQYSHAEGFQTTASGSTSHSEGRQTKAFGNWSHAEGYGSQALGDLSHAEGDNTIASGTTSHAEGSNTTAIGIYSHAEGYQTTASGQNSHAEGNSTIAGGPFSHAEGYVTISSGNNSHAEGNSTIASGDTSHAEGYDTKAYGDYSHSEGFQTISEYVASHAEGYETRASWTGAHSEGWGTTASNTASHAGGYNSIASGPYSFVHGENSIATNTNTIVFGGNITGTSANSVYVPNMIINTGGTQSKLGINTSTPEYIIDVNGNSARLLLVDTYTGADAPFKSFSFSGNSNNVPQIVASTSNISGGNGLGLQMGVLGNNITPTSSTQLLGTLGDTYLSSSQQTNNLNILNRSGGSGTNHIRMYAGVNSVTAAPNSDFHIQGDGATRGYIGINNDNPSEILHIVSTSSSKIRLDADINNSDETATAAILLTQDGYGSTANIGISPDVNNDLLIGVNSGGGTTPDIRFNTRSDGTVFTTSADTKMILKNDGKLGINTENPSEILDVSGKTKTIEFQMTSGATAGYVLTSDASGNASWQSVSGGTGGVPEATTATTTTINFTGQTIYYNATTPGTGNISQNLTGSKLGLIQKIYHNDVAEPLYPAGWVLMGDAIYFTSTLNIIYAEWATGSRVEYWYVQEQ